MHRFSAQEGLSPNARFAVKRDIDRLAGASHFLSELLAGRGPTQDALEAAPFLQAWMNGAIPAPVYMGRVSGHPAILNGAVAVTSPIIVSAEEQRWIRTLSRLYRLGDPIQPNA